MFCFTALRSELDERVKEENEWRESINDKEKAAEETAGVIKGGVDVLKASLTAWAMLLTIALVVMVALVIYRVRRRKRTAKRDPESQVILEDSSGASSSISSSDQSSVVDISPDLAIQAMTGSPKKEPPPAVDDDTLEVAVEHHTYGTGEDSLAHASGLFAESDEIYADVTAEDGAGPTFRHTTKFQLAGPPKSLQLQDESAGDSFI